MKSNEVISLINWKVRWKNLDFWLALIPAVLLLASVVLDLFGIKYDFNVLNDKLIAVIKALFMVLTILGIVNDPTTDSLKDSQRAMSYQEPFKD